MRPGREWSVRVACMARNRVKQESPEQVIAKKRRAMADRETVVSFLERLVLMVVLLWGLFTVVFGMMAMPNDDMSPRISAGDLMLYYRLETEFVADDVVVLEKDGTTYVGRIVARGGDTVEITDSAELKINNSTVAESGIYYSTPKYDADVSYPLTLAENQYFVLCDYREGARDSRYFGAVELGEIKGKVITVIRRSNL